MTTPSSARVEAVCERLYGLLPAHIRAVDAANGLALKALIQVVAGGSAEIDQEIDTLYDSMFVETAPEGALVDLAALVASTPLQPLPPGAEHSDRAFIANTVRYRRGKGTARVLEQLGADVGGFGAVAVEYFMRLARTQNLIDVRPERPGFADLVPGQTAARAETAFDILPRLVDVRSIARIGGRQHVPNVGLHLLRPVTPNYAAPTGVTPKDLADTPKAWPWPTGGGAPAGYFQLAAQPGRPLHLFNPDRRAAGDRRRAYEVELPDRLRRLPLHLETEELRQAALENRALALGVAPWFDAAGQPFTIFLRNVGEQNFVRVAPAEVLIVNLEAAPSPAGARPAATRAHSWFTGGTAAAAAHTGVSPISCAFDPATGRLIVAAPASGAPEVEEVRIAYAYGICRPIGAGAQDRNSADTPFDIVDTDSVKNLVWVVDPTQPAGPISPGVAGVQSLADALAAWTTGGQGKRGLIVLVRAESEGAPAPGLQVTVHPSSELQIVSAQWRAKKQAPGVADNPSRLGYVVRSGLRFTLDAAVSVVSSAAGDPTAIPGQLVLDGLEFTAGVSLAVRSLSHLLIRHCTVRAPGAAALATTAALDGMAIQIDRSIMGRMRLDFGSARASGSLVVTDSIVSADEATGDAITAATVDAQLSNVTLLGTTQFKSLEATNVIFTGACQVTWRQTGCVRYSAVAAGSAAPRRFRCQPDLALAVASATKGSALTAAEADSVALGVTPLFLDVGLDEPTVAMLHAMTLDAVRFGGEGDSEMGVFSAAAEGLRMANVTRLFDDFIPFGLEAGLIDDTRSGAVALRRNTP